MSFKEVSQRDNFGQAERGEYYQTKVTMLLIRAENAFYKACANVDCKKKVIDMENGMYRCEKCNRESQDFKYLLLGFVSTYLVYILLFYFSGYSSSKYISDDVLSKKTSR